jgi:hypothetical protein
MSDSTDKLTDAMNGPLRVSGDQGSVESRSADDLIKLDKYLSAKAANKVGVGIRYVRIVPPGAADVDLTDNDRLV